MPYHYDFSSLQPVRGRGGGEGYCLRTENSAEIVAQLGTDNRQ